MITRHRALIREDTDTTFLTQIWIDSGGNLTPVQTTHYGSIAYAVHDREELIGSGALVVASVIFDTLQTGTIWVQDTVGYNFKTQLANTLFPTGSRRLTVEFIHMLSGGTKFHDVWDLTVDPLRTT